MIAARCLHPLLGGSCVAAVRQVAVVAVLGVIVLLDQVPVLGQAITPTSPSVQKAIERGVAFLEANDDDRLGAQALVGRVMLALDRRDHPRIGRAVEAIRRAQAGEAEIDMYSLGLSLIFLIEADREAYRPEIEKLLKNLQHRQKPHGGWGYTNRTTGDTSMTQYAVLSAWMANDAGFESPRQMWVNVLRWYLQIQDPTGGYGYQAILPNQPDKLVAQHEISPTLTYASLASLYLCGKQLGLVSFAPIRQPPPNAKLQAVEAAPPVTGPDPNLPPEFDMAQFNATIDRGMGWYHAHARQLPAQYHFYFFYTLERLETIREYVLGRRESNPTWYQDTAVAILKAQMNNGGWRHNEGDVPATAFAVLTLIRSTQKVIEKTHLYGDGVLISGRGLPAGDSAVEVRQGKVKQRPLSGPAEELFQRLNNVDSPEFDRALGSLEDLAQAADLDRLSPVAKQLRALAANGPAQAKAAALRALAKTRNFADVPLLIEALNSSDDGIVRAADEGLRLLTRRVGLPPLGQTLTAEDRAQIVARWQVWYDTVYPDANRN